MLVLNGATNGTAWFTNQTLYVPSLDQMPFFQSLASGPVGTPAIYNPNAGLGSTSIARMYHSVALLLPDASMLIAGSIENSSRMGSTASSLHKQALFRPQSTVVFL